MLDMHAVTAVEISGEVNRDEDVEYEVVQWLLDTEPLARLVPVPGFSSSANSDSKGMETTTEAARDKGESESNGQDHYPWTYSGNPPCALRFTARKSGTSGLFVARIQRLANAP